MLLEALKRVEEKVHSEGEDMSNLQDAAEAEETVPPPTKKVKATTASQKLSMINAKAKLGHTPLHLAVEKNHMEVRIW